MNKQELVEVLAEEHDLSKKVAGDILNTALGVIGGALEQGETVQLIGFGTFKVTNRAARTGRNPSTGEAIEIKASKSVGFKAGKTLKDRIAG